MSSKTSLTTNKGLNSFKNRDGGTSKALSGDAEKLHLRSLRHVSKTQKKKAILQLRSLQFDLGEKTDSVAIVRDLR